MSHTQETRKSAETLLHEGMSAMRQAYYGDVREYAEVIRQAIVDDELTDSESLRERISETVDGTQWVIYTFNAQVVCLVSDNDGTYADEYGTEGLVKDGDINWSAIAYAAMERDIYEALEDADVDVNGEDKAEMLGEHPAEEER